MKKGTILIVAYALVLAVVVSVKVAEVHVAHSQSIHGYLLADCNDPPVNTSGGE